ncbi:MAG TPA: DUF1801 domain-containing protein [Flavobacteriaceae bacterium]|nr:DUF1801 domain-containing protein [Flavobacteriaceae bacterium]MCB9212793.1 DUF1801 domain-containing protein [Alteromonas sp.]HPF12048.1 DUF1801 domain-containing protein [Flavobacteriaceae bacterium]HQU21308.1 DUF1801 domain-containing protein [Flavobacteriaceae bacterium]HQU66218.1 DUF1801 domain-containing protein [Flavobacteriaceae bacterium]
MKLPITTVDAYIEGFSQELQALLQQVRQTILAHAPQAVESISYGMPAYKTQKRPLVYFAGYDKHIGFYATPSGHAQFAKKLAKYKQGKGSVQFPLDQPIPFDLIAEIVAFRVKENEAKK